jgi:hypothetical protein
MQDGSEYYTVAAMLKRIFEEKYAKMIKDDGACHSRCARATNKLTSHSDHFAEDPSLSDTARPPTLLDKKMFSQNVYNISSEDLGRVVHLLDQRCEACIKKIDPEDIEIDIDAIDNTTFWTVDSFVKECLPGARRTAQSKKPFFAKAPAGEHHPRSTCSIFLHAGVSTRNDADDSAPPKAKKPRTVGSAAP